MEEGVDSTYLLIRCMFFFFYNHRAYNGYSVYLCVSDDFFWLFSFLFNVQKVG
jgi:hypothetical protein